MQRATFQVAILLLAMSGFSVFAEGFSSRVAEAKTFSKTLEGSKYDELLGPLIGETMGRCIPPGSTDPKHLGSFTYVSLVDPEGTQRNFAVEPHTVVSACFKNKFSGRVLSLPPDYHGNKQNAAGYPIVVEMKVTP